MRSPRRPPATWVSWAILALIAGAGVWAFWWEPGRLVVREAELSIEGWPEENRGLRVALVSDLHVGSPRNGLASLRRVVRRIEEAEPDLVLLAGDLVISGIPGGRFVDPETIAGELAALRPRLGKFAVLGNHDRWLDAERVVAALGEAGFEVLEDSARLVEGHGFAFWLGGVSDFWTGRHDLEGTIAQASGGEPLVLFTHNPDIFPMVPARVAVTFAGHTHGGQVLLPVLGRLLVPSRYGERFAAGHVVEDGQHLFVTTGVGTSRLGVRFRVPPEIAVVELHPAARPAPAAARD